MHFRPGLLIGALLLIAASCGDSSTRGADEALPSIAQDESPSTTSPASPPATSPASPPVTESPEDGAAITSPGEDPPETPTTVATVGQAPSTTSGGETTAPAASEGSGEAVFEQGDIDPGLQPFIDQAIADLAARNSVDPSDITVLSAVLVVWPDASLGCPQPGMVYTQVPVDGSVIELGSDGKVHRYHTGGQQGPFLCEQQLDKTPPTGDVGLGGTSDSDY